MPAGCVPGCGDFRFIGCARNDRGWAWINREVSAGVARGCARIDRGWAWIDREVSAGVTRGCARNDREEAPGLPRVVVKQEPEVVNIQKRGNCLPPQPSFPRHRRGTWHSPLPTPRLAQVRGSRAGGNDGFSRLVTHLVRTVARGPFAPTYAVPAQGGNLAGRSGDSCVQGNNGPIGLHALLPFLGGAAPQGVNQSSDPAAGRGLFLFGRQIAHHYHRAGQPVVN